MKGRRRKPRRNIVTAISPDGQFYAESSGIEITLKGNEPEFIDFLYSVAEWMDRLELDRFVIQRHPYFQKRRQPIEESA